VKALAALIGVLWSAGALGLELEGGTSYEHLTNGNPPWKSIYLEGAHTFEPRQTLYGALREVERFDLRDSQIEAGYYHPFSPKLTGQVEANASSQHNFLAKSSLFAGLAQQLDGGWVASGGYRHNEYTAASTRIINAGLERYFASYRAYYTLNNGRPEDNGSATAHRFGLDHYYADERSRVGVSVTFGREVENIVPNGIVTSDVRAFGIYGRHWLSQAWALSWELGTHEQGDFYRRTGGRLGLRHDF
jgi:YaiO family outer membrane protein